MTSSTASGKTHIPSLDELLISDNPAWLWDGERARIVWANHAGTEWFGAETLFDLLEIVFNEDEADVATIKKLTTRLPRGESAPLQMKLSAAASSQRLDCTCFVHTLADGRPGLLVCADSDPQASSALPAAVQAMALGAFPLPICVVSGSGEMMFSNDELQAMLPADNDRDFILDLAGELIEKCHGAGLTSGLKSIATRHGKRDIRVIARPLEKSERPADSTYLLVLEDVTERRSLERSLLAAADAQLADEDDDAQQETEIELELSTAPEEVLAEPSDSPKETPLEALEPSADKVEPSAVDAVDNEPSVSQLDNEVVRALTALRREIEKQTSQVTSKTTGTETAAKDATTEKPVADKPAVEKAEKASAPAAKKDDDTLSVPDIVSSTLNSLPQPLVLVDQKGDLLFANNITVELMGVKTWQEIGERTTLGDALAALDGEDGSISLFTAKDEPVNFDVNMSVFPWQDGPVYQATLSPGSDGEEADNRRSIGNTPTAQKKTLKK